ncbi:MAG: hypothetical protein ABFD96_19215 [Armatimonadia bacterium]
MRPSTRLILLLLILLTAFTLRTYGLRSLVYANPDEALWSFFIVTSAELSPFSPHPSENALAKIMSWDYGYPLFVADHLYVRTLEALNLPVNEATLPGVLVILGALTCLLVFFVARRFAPGNDTPGLVAAALFAVIPLLVGRHRTIGGAEAANGFLFVLAVLMLIRYWEAPASTRRQWLAGLAVGLWMCADVQLAVTGSVLIAFVLLWPRPDGYTGWVGLRRLLVRPGTLLPPVLLFAPYLPVYLYALKLGYPDQTFLGTMLNEHKADWGLHLIPFLRDLWVNLGLIALLAIPVALVLLRTRFRDRRYQWLLAWIGLTALPFLIAVTSKVTEASGYHHHLTAALCLLTGLAFSSTVGAHRGAPALPAAGTPSDVPVAGASLSAPRRALPVLGLLIVLATAATTLGGVFRVPAIVPLYPSPKIPYGGLVPNSGMKTAGYWVRQNLAPAVPVFVAHDPSVAYWYLGREALTGGYIDQPARKPVLLDNAASVQAAVIPEQYDLYPDHLMRSLGFRGLMSVTRDSREVLRLYTKRPLRLTLPVEQYDALYNQTYRTAAQIIPPPFPYVPGKFLKP